MHACMCVQNPLGQLKDLVELKDQLEDIQRRVEDEIQAGVPAVRLTQPQISTCSGYSAWIVFTGQAFMKTVYQVPGLISHLLSSLGRQSSGFSFPEGFSGRVRCCQTTLFSVDGRCCRNMHRNLCSTKLRRSQHRKHRQRLHTQPERKVRRQERREEEQRCLQEEGVSTGNRYVFQKLKNFSVVIIFTFHMVEWIEKF